MDLSVIVCTYNRSRLLAQLLESALGLELPEGVEWELLVIDNNSDDDTRHVVERFKERLPIRYAFEPQQGKTHALNRALGMSRGRLLLFSDDDVVLPRHWLTNFLVAADDQCEFSWFGGKVKPDWKGARPRWYREETASVFSGFFVDYDLGDQSRPYLRGEKRPLGASLAVRREVFKRVGGFRTDLGPRGKLRGVGDETELIERAAAEGMKGFYVGESPVLHYVAPNRTGISALLNYGFGKGLNQYRMGVDRQRRGSLERAGSQALRGALQILKGRGDRARICLINIGIELGRIRAARTATRL